MTERLPLEWGFGVVAGVAAFLAVRGVNPLPLILLAALAGGLLLTPAGRRIVQTVSHHRRKPSATPEVRFDEIGGQDAAKRELREAVDFLRHPAAASALGIHALHGVLLAGPPGTGKTLLAKAAASYTHSGFLSAAGSEFIEMYAGVGAQRIRDLFGRARSEAKERGLTSAIIFVDELDVLGAKRGSQQGHLEYDQTLNQLLVEMDGMGTKDDGVDVLVIGATNRADLLDDALLRPGRFDRVVRVELPDRRGRLEILQLVSKGRPLAGDVDLDGLARETFGMSGAHLESLLNEAGILALRAGDSTIRQSHLSEAVEKVMLGERLDRRPDPDEMRRVAVHEGGHAMMAEYLRPGSVASITITSRGQALGYVRQAPRDDVYLRTRPDLEIDIAVALAGSVAEELVLGSRSTGAASDFAQAAGAARHMVLSGMSPLGVVAEATLPPQALHDSVSEILSVQENRVREILLRYRTGMLDLADALLRDERLEAQEVRTIVGLDPTAA